MALITSPLPTHLHVLLLWKALGFSVCGKSGSLGSQPPLDSQKRASLVSTNFVLCKLWMGQVQPQKTQANCFLSGEVKMGIQAWSLLGPPPVSPAGRLQQVSAAHGLGRSPHPQCCSSHRVPPAFAPAIPHGSSSLSLQLWARAETHCCSGLACDSPFLWGLAFPTGTGPRKAAGSVSNIPSAGFSKDLPSNL